MIPEQAYEAASIETISPAVETSSSEGFFSKISSMFANKLDLSRERCIEIALYCSVGFVIGFLCKKYNFYLFLFIFMLLIMVGLDYCGLITFTIHADKINSYIGYAVVPHDATFFTTSMQWIKEHLHASISFAIGFVLGILVA